MKTAKALLLAGLVALAVPAHAQFSNASKPKEVTATTSSGTGLIKNCTPYNRISASYVNRNYDSSKGYATFNEDDSSTNGFAIDYIHGFSLVRNLPLFLETGVGIDMGFWQDSDEDEDITYKVNLTTMSFSVPVNLAYKLQFSDSFSLTPYLGLNFKLHALATYKPHVSYDGDDDDVQDYIDEINDEMESINFFDKDDVDKDYRWSRFQVGWHVGVGANFNKFYVGLSYGTDFNTIWKKTSTGTFKVGLGYNF